MDLPTESEVPAAAGDSNPAETKPKRSRSPRVAALLSFVWPGLGQLYAGRRIAAAVFGIPTAIVASWVIYQVVQNKADFSLSFLDDSVALTAFLVVVLIGGWRLLAMAHAAAVVRPLRLWRRLDVALLGVLVLIVVASHSFVAAYPLSAYNFDQSIVSDNLLGIDGTPAPNSGPTDEIFASQPPDSPTPAPTYDTSGTFNPADYSGPTMTPMPVRPINPNRITVLLTGVDFTMGRSHWLNDTMIVVSVDTRTRKVAMISVPRDTAAFDLYYGGWVGATFKLNSLATEVSSGKLHSPDDGITTLKKELGFLLGIPVDYYVAVNIDSFSSMVDLVGGVDVYNPRALNDPFTGTFVPKGMVHLDGPGATKYVRSRHGAGDSDYTRAARQQAVLVALEHKITSAAMLPVLPQLLSLAGSSIQTDFPLRTARSYVSLGRSISDAAIMKCVLGPPYSYHPDSAYTRGTWTSRLDMNRVASLSVYAFGGDSQYYGRPNVKAAACAS
jgi:polyisoprenyl-teichoic acid--peptidoglycan teichoic acid transferase